jgi:hypothetical protein
VTFDESYTQAVDIWCGNRTNHLGKMSQKIDNVRQDQRLAGLSVACIIGVRFARLPER